MRVFELTLSALLISSTFAVQDSDAFRRALEALRQNKLDVSLEELTAAEKAEPDNAQVHNFRGVVLARLGRAADAETEYRKAIRLDPATGEAYRNLGYLLWSSHRLVQARQVLAEALKLGPEDSYAHYYLGRVELEAGHYPEAVSHLERGRESWPRDTDFLLDLSAAYLAMHRPAAAREILSNISSRSDLTIAQSVRLGSLLCTAQEADQALRLFGSIAASNPGARWAQFNLALANLRKGNAGEAAARALRLAQGEDSPAAWTVLGAAYARAGKQADSVAAFRKAADLAPGQEERWLDLTHELMADRKYLEAVAAAHEGLTHNSKSYALHLRLGAAYLKSGHYKEAEEVFRDLVSREDPLPTSVIGLAQVLLRTGRPQEAADELASARQHLGPSFLLAYFRGIALDRAAQPEQAVQEFKEAVRLSPQNAEAHQWLGKVELRLRQVDLAIGELKEALRLDPSNQPARRLLAQASAIQHHPEEAENFLRQIEPGTLPKGEGDELEDYFLPPFEMPEAETH